MKRLAFMMAALALMAVGCSDSGTADDNTPPADEVVPDIIFEGGVEPAPVLKADGSAVTVKFTATAEWSAHVGKNGEWLTLTPQSGEAGEIEMSLTAEANEEYDQRSAAVYISSGSVDKTLNVVQKQKGALLLGSNKVDMSYEGGEIGLGYESSMGEPKCEVESSAQSWIKRVETSGESAVRGLEGGVVTLQVEPNTSENSRTGKVTLTLEELSETVTVSQIGRQPGLIVAQTEYRVPAAGGALKIEVQDNVDETPAVSCPADWIHLEQGSRAMSTYAFNFTVDRNDGSAVREAAIEFSAFGGKLKQSVTVMQPARSENLFVWPNNEQSDGITRAFPGAEGGGMYTTGGRGGKVYHVTNLNDSGAGSLRYGLDMNDARIIVFDVAGDIILKSDIGINKGNLTIAGQTAPGDGICVRGGTINIKCSNVIIRYMRFRLGDESKFLSDGSDAIWGRYNENIILDHCSMSWSVDEVASFYANRNFTMQWCMVAESMCNSVHGKGGHGYGGIWGGRNASFHHNMLAHNKSRNARIDHPEIYGVHVAGDGSVTFDYIPSHRGNVDYRNNVIYNWGDNNTYGGEDGWFNMVGNYYKPGPASKDRKYYLDADGYYSSGKRQYDYPRLYLDGNHHTKYPEFDNDQQAGIYLHDGDQTGNPKTMFLSAPLPIMKDDTEVCRTTTHTAARAFDNVLNYVGVSHRRDAVDAHIVHDARNGVATYPMGSNGSTGGIIDSQKDVGGWPVLTATPEEISRAATDTDGDGIPDYYEDLLGLDKNNSADAEACDFDSRYSNLEMYLHYLVQDTVAAQVEGGIDTELK